MTIVPRRTRPNPYQSAPPVSTFALGSSDVASSIGAAFVATAETHGGQS